MHILQIESLVPSRGFKGCLSETFAGGGQKPAREHTPQMENLLSGYALNSTEISFNYAPILNNCHLSFDSGKRPRVFSTRRSQVGGETE